MQTSKRRTPRDPDATRASLLRATFQEVHRSGFQGTDLDTILRAAGVTKGALYHHFENKDALGYALVDEFLMDLTRDKWLAPLADALDPIEALTRIVQTTSLRPRDVENGCPVNNLAQEMSSIDEGFRTRIEGIYEEWRGALEKAFQEGIRQGTVRKGVRPRAVAAFIVSTHAGIIGTAKNARSVDLLKLSVQGLKDYLESLRP